MSDNATSDDLIGIDLFSGAGGVGTAFDTLGIDHVGFDKDDHSDRYPGEFVQRDLTTGGTIQEINRYATEYDTVFLWLSPPCQRWSTLTSAHASRYDWPDGEIERRYPGFEELGIRDLIAGIEWDEYVLENVKSCPHLEDRVRVNGHAFDLGIQFLRHFETSFECPDAVETGTSEIVIGEGYVRDRLAEIKGVPRGWPVNAIRAAIPTEYVQYFLHHAPSVDGVSVPDSLTQRPLTDFTDQS